MVSCHDPKTCTSDLEPHVCYSQVIHPSCCSLHQEEFTLRNTQGSLQSRMPGSNSETWGRVCDSFGSNTVLQYPVCPILTLHSRITAREYVDRLGNRVHPMNQTLFLKNNALFQEDSAPLHTAGTIESSFVRA
jgi:hypothetical protein